MMITAIEYLKNPGKFSDEEVQVLKRHAEEFLFYKYDELRLWNRELAESLHELYCEVLYEN